MEEVHVFRVDGECLSELLIFFQVLINELHEHDFFFFGEGMEGT